MIQEKKAGKQSYIYLLLLNKLLVGSSLFNYPST